MSRMPVWGSALLALALAPGCASSDRAQLDTYGTTQSFTWHGSEIVYSWDGERWVFQDRSEPRPDLALSGSEVARSMARATHAAATRRRIARQALEVAEPYSVEDTAEEIRALYAAGERDAANALAARHPGVATWEHAADLVTLDCHFRERPGSETDGGALEVVLRRRPGVTGALAICFPPGTYGAGGLTPAADGDDASGKPRWTNPDDDRKYGHWPSVQDLAFLQAPVVVIPEGQELASLRVPVACASFGSSSPIPDMAYSLRRFPEGSAVDRLLLELCSADQPQAPEPEVQLAMWLSRNDITWDAFRAEGGASGLLITFGSATRIFPHAATGAAELLVRSGIDPHAVHFFGGPGIPDLDGPPAQTASTPAPAPAPAAPAPAEQPALPGAIP